jgi:predicted DNA-binding helix-hairpin-helix protein
MPGTSRHLIQTATELADRIGINLEAPNKQAFGDLCTDKGGFKEAVLKRMEWIISEADTARARACHSTFGNAKSGVDTQMIVGATDDNDWQYVQATQWLYKSLKLKRVYYSAFEPIPQTPLEKRPPCSHSREHRLYQTSFLIRDYNFKADDFAPIINDEGFLPNADPKLALARSNPDTFPIDLNNAAYNDIIRIPRVGPKTAKKIVQTRQRTQIRYSSDLEQIIGSSFTRRIRRYVYLKDKKLEDSLVRPCV